MIERVSEVFGTCGFGWRYLHSPEELVNGKGQAEIVTEVALRYRRQEEAGDCQPVAWDAQARGPAPSDNGSAPD